MDIETLAQRFEDYHEANKSLATGIDTLGARLDEFELMIGRRGLPKPGDRDQVDLHEVGEAFRAYIKSGDPRKIGDLLEGKGMSVGNDPEGGYSVYPTLSSMITKRIFETSPIRPYARVVTIGTDAFEELLDIEEAEANWVGETESRTDTTTPDLGKLIIPAHEIYAMPKVTQKLLDDSSIDIGGWLVEKVGNRFARRENAAFVTGDGIRKPRGFLSYGADSVATDDSTRAWGKLQYVPSGAANNFASTNPADVLVNIQSELKSVFRTGAAWMMNRRTAGVIRQFKDSNGRFLWTDSLAQGQPPMLLGHPVSLAEDMPSIGAGTFPVAFGDFRAGYTIVDRSGDKLLRDPFTDKPNVRFYMYRRVGGDVTNFEAIKLLKIATS